MGNILKRYTGTNWETVSGAITGDTLPIGSIVAYSSNNAPTNWLICDGSAVNRVTYADLFSVIGTTYGAGDGTTTFNLPNAKGRVITGLDSSQTEFNAIGKTGGEKAHQLTVNEMPSHNHSRNGQYGGKSTPTTGVANVISNNDGTDWGGNTTGNKGGDRAHNNLQPYLTGNIIIKAFQSSGVVADVVQVNTVSDTNTYSCNYINDLDTYSTTEQVIGKWIDGKPIYRKIITGMPSVAYNEHALKDSGIITVDTIISSNGQIKRNGVNKWYSLDNAFLEKNFNKTNGQIEFYGAMQSVNFDAGGYMILEYTKTTD